MRECIGGIELLLWMSWLAAEKWCGKIEESNRKSENVINETPLFFTSIFNKSVEKRLNLDMELNVVSMVYLYRKLKECVTSSMWENLAVIFQNFATFLNFNDSNS